jgi:hypothetical protein
MAGYARAASGGKIPSIMRVGKNYHSDLLDGGGGYPGDYPGRVYYVNNISGLSTNDGLTWETAFDEVSTAITASEAYRQLPALTTNEYIRNVIYVQGTGTAYTKLTALPSYCDLIGIGAEVRGNGAGIARIGADADTTPASAVDATAVRGLYMEGLQFQAGSGYAAFDCASIFRTKIVNCAFYSNNTAVEPSAGLTFGVGSGLVVENCHWGGPSGSGDPAIGIHISGTHFHGCAIRDCFIVGDVGFQLDVACTSTYDSIVENCYIGSGFTAQTASIDDNSLQGWTVYRNNQIAVNGTLANNGAARWINNWITNGVAPVAVTAS